MADRDAESHGTVYDSFSEFKEVCSLLDTLPRILNDFRALEMSQERLTVIVDKYQEQPHLLDPHLEQIIDKLFTLVRLEDAPPTLIHQSFKYLYLFSKVRGPKVIVRWFSHEVTDLDPALNLLQEQEKSDASTWETRYILLLWLSIIVIIPFDMSRLDGSTSHTHSSENHTHFSTIDRILNLGKYYLNSTDKTQDSAAMLCAKFLSRPDVQKLKLSEFLEWVRDILAGGSGQDILKCGILKTLATLFKIAKREEVLPHASQVLQIIVQYNLSIFDSMLLRKLYMKLTQRLGTTFLPMRVLSWRYQRGSRSLEQTLAAPVVMTTADASSEGAEEEEEFDIPEEVEEILGILLTGLKDRDTIVRWSSAKGIGRITGRLPRALANEILDSLLDCFSSRESDSAWHGGCLALAELGRRGLLLPHRLPDVIPIVLRALLYDERRGSNSIGSHVRDAACYVCWSFARAYNPDQMKLFVEDIAKTLIIEMLFDREVNCRKAASAAFQENVGRQGMFPHGIDILTMADYFAVGNLTHVYLELSLEIGRYPEYTHALIDHLPELKLGHWDSVIRDLASRSLAILSSLDPDYMKEKILPKVLSQITSFDQCLRHGSLLATAEITFALAKIAHGNNQSTENYLGAELIESLVGVASRLLATELFKGYSGELMRSAILKFIEYCCLAEVIANNDVLEVWQSIIDDNLSSAVESIRETAAKSLGVVCRYKYCSSPTLIAKVQDISIPFYLKQLLNNQYFIRMGFALGLGALPKQILEGKLDQILECLMTAVTDIEGPTAAKYSESRRDAVRAIERICGSVDFSVSGPSTHTINETSLNKIFSSLFIAMDDYSTDSRGDIAAVVREAGMTALESLCLRLSTVDPPLLKPRYVMETVGRLIQQSNEKIDRTRALACSKLLNLIHHQPPIANIPHHDLLLGIFNNDDIADVNWSVPQSSFPFTVQTLRLPSYSSRALLGLIISVGGLTESLVRSASVSFLYYMQSLSENKSDLDSFTEQLLTIFDQNAKNSRVIIPLFKTLDLLFSNCCLNLYLTDQSTTSFPCRLLEKVKAEMKQCRDPVKILSSINVFCGLLQFSAVRQSCFVQLMILLGHSYPKVRRTTADQLYTTLITYDEELFPAAAAGEDVAEEVMTLLSETQWDGKVQVVREERNKVNALLKLPPLKLKAGSGKVKQVNQSDDMGYKDLVERMGY